MDSSTHYHPAMKLKQQQKCELTYLAFYPASSLGANYTDGVHNHWQIYFRGNVAWCSLHLAMKGQLPRSTPQIIINQGTTDIVNKPDFISVLDLEKVTTWSVSSHPVGRAIHVGSVMVLLQHFTPVHTITLLEIHLASACHSYNKTFHGKSNGCLSGGNYMHLFFPSWTLSVLQWTTLSWPAVLEIDREL